MPGPMKMLSPYESVAGAAVIAGSRMWLERAVIGLQLCPFAKAVYLKKQIRYAVTAASDAAALLLELNSELALLARTSADEIDTTLLIHPAVMNDFLDYNCFLDEVDAALRSLDLEGVLQVASFHPQYQFAGTTSDSIDNYTNRSPYPMLHLLREASIDKAVAAFPDAADIYETNIATLRRVGHEGWRKLWVTQ
jgi:hypothetical protein